MDKRIGDFYFKRTNGERVLLAENIGRETAFNTMKQFLGDHNYKSYYTRTWETNGELWMDVGSWSEFFVLVYKDGDAS